MFLSRNKLQVFIILNLDVKLKSTKHIKNVNLYLKKIKYNVQLKAIIHLL